MQKERFQTPMHPEAEHNYAIDFTDLLQGIGGDSEVITGTPIVTVIDSDPSSPGFTAVFQGLDATSRKVIFKAGVGTSDHDDAAYEGEGALICIQANIVSTSSPAEVQQGELIVQDQC